MARGRQRARHPRPRPADRPGAPGVHRVRARPGPGGVLCGAGAARRRRVPPDHSGDGTGAADRMSPAERAVEHVTCLGCGCACDDITLVVKQDRVAAARNACTLGVAWFGDGSASHEVRVDGRSTSLEQALARAAEILRAAKRPLVYLAADISCEAQREAVAIGDHLGAMLDTLTSAAAASVLAAQRRGPAGAAAGEPPPPADRVLLRGRGSPTESPPARPTTSPPTARRRS